MDMRHIMDMRRIADMNDAYNWHNAESLDFKLPSGSGCDHPQGLSGYDALPARCVRMRFCVGPEYNNKFVIYSLDVTLVGNS